MPITRDDGEAGDDATFESDRFEPIFRTSRTGWDDESSDPEATTYTDALHGPGPIPEWVITADAARQYERGVLKSGKEADVYLVERRLGDATNLLAAKRYRDFEERTYRNDAKYRRRAGSRRADLAMAKGTRTGLGFRAALWMQTEWDALAKLWAAGAPVPYPVQKLNNEVLLEYLGNDEGAAPRLVQASTSMTPAQLTDAFAQTVEIMRVMSRAGLVHGDLSAYNLLVWEERVWVIDLPQAVDPIRHAEGMTLLRRDVSNVCRWFSGKGVATDEAELLVDLVSLVQQ